MGDPGGVDARLVPDIFALPQLSVRQDEVLRFLFRRLLSTGQAVPETAVGTWFAQQYPDVDAAAELEILIGSGRTVRNGAGAFAGALGLTLDTTAHEVVIAGAPWHTWCVLDALGIVGALSTDAALRSAVPDSEGVVSILFTRGEPTGGDLGGVVLVPAYQVGTPVRTTWCPQVNVFPDASAAQQWSDTHGVPGRKVPLVEAWAAATERWRPRI